MNTPKKPKLPAVHPGQILQADFMLHYPINAGELAAMMGVPADYITEIIAGKRAITTPIAQRLEECFGVSAEFWMNLQKTYELECVQSAT